ncbi:MAG: hypothetical protein ABSE57_06305 [Bryobacteraceae bacterium]
MIGKTWMVALVAALPSARPQPAIAPPQLGFVRDSAWGLRRVYGVTGSFVLGSPLAGKIVSEAFSGSIGLLKTDSSLAAFDSTGKRLASINAAGGPALFAFSSGGSTALAYIPSSNSLIEWRGSVFALVPANYDEPDTVLAIAFPTPLEAALMVQRKDTIWELDLPLGKNQAISQHALIGVRAPMLALPTGDLVYSDSHGIVVRRSDATEVHIAAPLPASFSLQQMNQNWVLLMDLNSSAQFAIHTAPGREGFYRLPE